MVPDENPYSPPQKLDSEVIESSGAVREIVLGWEKLRIFYNVFLVLAGCVAVGVSSVSGNNIGFSILFILIPANLAFFLGPLAELYIRGALRRGEAIGRGRYLIFGAGLVVSIGFLGLGFYF